jgi:hypothetical protein
MSEQRKKPLWPWIAALLIGLPVLYVLSRGPVEWLYVWGYLPNWTVAPMMTFYSPISWILENGPQPLKDVIHWYLDLWRNSVPPG